MKKLMLFGFLVFAVTGLIAQDESEKKEVTKDGWNFGALPTITYIPTLAFSMVHLLICTITAMEADTPSTTINYISRCRGLQRAAVLTGFITIRTG